MKCARKGCRNQVERPAVGRPRTTCSNACRMAVYRARRRRSVHHTSDSDEWYTPPELLGELAARHGPFDLDPCACPASPCWPLIPSHITPDQDGLVAPWFGVVFVNPPYSALRRWVERAVEQLRAGSARRVVMLIPARTDTRAWWTAIEAGAVPEFLRGRVSFVLPDGSTRHPAPFPSAVLVLDADRVS